MVDPMWEDWSRDGQFIKARDMCRFCPTVGRNATGLVKILTTRTAKTRAAEPFDSCVHSYAIVALTTSYIRVVYSSLSLSLVAIF